MQQTSFYREPTRISESCVYSELGSQCRPFSGMLCGQGPSLTVLPEPHGLSVQTPVLSTDGCLTSLSPRAALPYKISPPGSKLAPKYVLALNFYSLPSPLPRPPKHTSVYCFFESLESFLTLGDSRENVF